MGLERTNPGHTVVHSPSGGSMNLTPRNALKIFWTLSIKKQADLLHEFAMMAQGSDGHWIPGGYPRMKIRQYYYPDWSNNDFQWVIDQINASP